MDSISVSESSLLCALASNPSIGEAFHNIKPEKLYPSVGMKKPGEHLRVNFGATPFVFDIDAMMEVSGDSSSASAMNISTDTS